MKTLILNGSPRKNGDTISLIEKLTEQLNGEFKIVDTYYSDVSPCVDCRYCWDNDGCSLNDGFAEINDYIQICDNIVIASPIYFSQLTGKMLDVCSRFQTYFAAKYFRKQNIEIKAKKGAVILVGGGDGNAEDAYKTACTIMSHINVKEIYPLVGSFKTNELSAKEDNEAIMDIDNIAKFLNK